MPTLTRAAVIVTSAILLCDPTFAQEPTPPPPPPQGTVVIEQSGGREPGKFGLITPSGSIESRTALLTRQGPPGVYTLTITPPPGASHTITTKRDDTVLATTQSRTISAELTVNATLTFSVHYVLDRLGEITVTFYDKDRQAVSVPFTLSGPYESLQGTTSASYKRMPEGTYLVVFDLSAYGCPALPPLSRALRKRERLLFSGSSVCPGISAELPEELSQPPTEEVEQPAVPALRVRLSADRREVAPEGSVRVEVGVANTGGVPLPGLTLDARVDTSLVAVTAAPFARLSANTIQWEIPTLSPGETWRQSAVLALREGVAPGTAIPMSMQVVGDALVDIPTGKRSASLSFSVMAMLPPSGVSLVWIFHALTILGIGLILSLPRPASAIAHRKG